MKQYDVWLHYKQGDIFADAVEHNKGNVQAAFRDLSEFYGSISKRCAEITEYIKPGDVEGDGGTHCIWLNPSNEQGRKSLELLESKELISSEELDFEDEEDFENGFEEDFED